MPLGDDWQSDTDFWKAGDKINSEVPHGTGLYSFPLAIQSLTVHQSLTIMVARLAKDIRHVQRRQAFRVRLLLDAQLHHGVDYDYSVEALLRDMSQTGARVSIPGNVEAPPEKSQARVVFDSADLGKMSVKCQIRWSKPQVSGYDLGLRFLQLETVESERLHEYLWEIQLKRLER